jgi:hypothetical protein
MQFLAESFDRRPPMPRSSETVAALASALAKAQAELINPEKSLKACIRTGRPGEGERSFRSAFRRLLCLGHRYSVMGVQKIEQDCHAP